MKVVVASTGPELSSKISNKFGTSRYFIVYDQESESFEAVPNPGIKTGRGAGMEAFMALAEIKPDILVIGNARPALRENLARLGIEMVIKENSTVQIGLSGLAEKREKDTEDSVTLGMAAKKAFKQLYAMLPVFLGIVFLLGLFSVFITPGILGKVFSGQPLLDSIWGAIMGGVIAGQPINSYVIGSQMLNQGVSIFGVAALVAAWVNVGVVQLPMEIVSLGKKFALIRNVMGLVFSVVIAWVMGLLFNFLNLNAGL